MPINRLYNKTVSTTRLADVAGSFRQQWAENVTSLECTIHPISGEQGELGSAAFYKTFKLFCPVGSDLEIGDKVIDGDNTYLVKGVKTYDFGLGESVHKQAIIILGE